VFELNRVIAHTGTQWPIWQAPMGWIARSRLVAAVANAGGLGILETSSREFDVVRRELHELGSLTDRPWAVNLPISFLKSDDSIVDDVLHSDVRFVTTSAGHPGVYAQRLLDSGINVYHAVSSVDAAIRAEDAGVCGLIVEGHESAAFRSVQEVHTFTLLQAIRRRVDLPIVAAGGIVDGVGMAAAFALGAEGVQMGTRFVASVESPVHGNYKRAIIEADGDATTVTNRGRGPCVRVLRTQSSEVLEAGGHSFGQALRDTRLMYFNGNMATGLASAGESATLIDRLETCQAIIDSTIESFSATVDRLRFC
jgi:enoyl-[acyl-carrier protein] reductase II